MASKRVSPNQVMMACLICFCLLQAFYFSKQERLVEKQKETRDIISIAESTLSSVTKMSAEASSSLNEWKKLSKAIEKSLDSTQRVAQDFESTRSEITRHLQSIKGEMVTERGRERAATQDIVPTKFVYVYDLGETTRSLTEDLEKSPIRWWSRQYEGEYELFDLLARKNVARTFDPQEAVLFYVPFYSARHTLVMHDTHEVMKMKESVEKTSKAWEDLITRIKSEFPYFNRSNGRDHFSALTMDHGRCTAIAFCNPKVYGEMFFFQLNADKMVRSNHATTSRHMQALTFNYGASPALDLPDIPCYMADRDIVLPPISSHTEIVKPQESERNIVALFRFSPGQHHGVPIPHFNHLIRKELLEMFKDKGIPGWDFAEKSEWDTRDDWKHSIFCISPPGHSQWTSRPTKSIISGCIPVTFYRDHDNPWQDELDWERFTVNIDPDQLASLPERIDHIMKTPGKLQEMQRALESVQEYFLWGPEDKNGARVHLMKALHKRAEKLLRSKSSIR